ncbi:non-homologous end joining protein Ku [Tranquillimonas alkanivorans]|uniref:Non-homologous end joining protein Ku n=1 Tax=Tranquillimonas alkanivorans TaxID=441119 RepID=A0A1I5MYH2_9RHOB|nr:Ku protein [Tranquillimonas alkanivorans]SFP14472.1 DNA end-binding protein Ku [Tranquillimonas alkanivorans]
MASRAVWKGQLRLSLVSIPVEIHSAKESGSKISFRQIHEPSGKRVQYQKVVNGIGPVDSDEIVKGYDLGGDEYMLLDPEEVDEIKLETKKTLELVQFVGACEIAPIWFDRPYYVVPSDDLAQDAYRVVRDALRQSERIGLGQLTMRGKEYLCALRPCGDGILLETLHYEEDIRSADPLFSQIQDEKADDELLDVAKQLIDRKTAAFDASAYKDRYAEQLRELIDAKMKSKGTARVSSGGGKSEGKADTSNVVDLMDALKKSLNESKGSSGKKTGGRKSPAKSSSGSKSSSSGTRKAPARKKA